MKTFLDGVNSHNLTLTEAVNICLFIYLFIYCLPEIINVTITCKQVWGRTVRLTS